MPGLGILPVGGYALEVRPLPSGLIELYTQIDLGSAATPVLQLLVGEAEALAAALTLACERVRQRQERP